jgi:hypothetical protein
MQAALSIEVPIFEGGLREAPEGGYVFAFDVPSAVDP